MAANNQIPSGPANGLDPTNGSGIIQYDQSIDPSTGQPYTKNQGAGGVAGGGGTLPGATTGAGTGSAPSGTSGIVGGATVADPSGAVSTPQSASAGSGLGAYDVWAQQAFGGPTDAEQQVYNQTTGQANGGAYAPVEQAITNQAGAQATAGVDPNLTKAVQAASNQYTGQDQSSAGMNAAQNAYMSMVGPQAGYSDAAKAAITNEGNSALNAQQATMQDQVNNAMARTGSPVGAYGALVDTSQNIGNQRAAQAAQNQVLFANEAERQKEAGATGLNATSSNILGRENTAMQSGLAAQQQGFGQQQTASNQANQFINDATSRNLATDNAASAQNAQQRAASQAGGAGLTNLNAQESGSQNQLYSMLASILGNTTGSTTAAGVNDQSFNVSGHA